MLPLFVPLSLILARPLAGWTWLEGRRLVVVAAVTAVALVSLKGVAGHVTSDRDSRDMARAIEKIIDPRSVDGIVFVSMRPFYGLNVYLDTNIEGVQINEHRWDYSKFVAEEDLCSELASRENNVYALKESKVERVPRRRAALRGHAAGTARPFRRGRQQDRAVHRPAVIDRA